MGSLLPNKCSKISLLKNVFQRYLFIAQLYTVVLMERQKSFLEWEASNLRNRVVTHTHTHTCHSQGTFRHGEAAFIACLTIEVAAMAQNAVQMVWTRRQQQEIVSRF